MYQDVVTVDPDVMSGAPVFKETRVLVKTLIDHIDAGLTTLDFMEGFPTVKRAQIEDCLNESSLFIEHAMFNKQGEKI
jgi:uncharacterized protein (DUF433 family)